MKKEIIAIILSAILVVVCFGVYYSFQLAHDKEMNRRAMEEDEIITKEIQKNREKWDSVSYRTIHADLSDENTKER